MQAGEAKKNPRFSEFFEAITRAEAAAEDSAVRMWQQAMPTDWRAAQMFLERRHPDRWGKQERLDLKHAGKVEVEHGVDVAGANALLAALGYGPLGSTSPDTVREENAGG